MKKKPGVSRKESIPVKIDKFINEKKKEVDALRKLLETFKEDDKNK